MVKDTYTLYLTAVGYILEVMIQQMDMLFGKAMELLQVL